LTIEALKSRRIRISGLIFNDCPGEDAVILKDNPDIVKKISKQNIIGSLPRRNNYRSLYKKFSSIAGKITL
jgi:dethiobiotin synthetase